MPETTTAPATEIVTINQGRAITDYFFIIQPAPANIEFKVNQVINCLNPKNKKVVRAMVTEHFFTFDWNEAPKGLILKEWGVDAGLLRTVLIGTDPAFEKETARLIIVKEII
jgi:hypothetical protein